VRSGKRKLPEKDRPGEDRGRDILRKNLQRFLKGPYLQNLRLFKLLSTSGVFRGPWEGLRRGGGNGANTISIWEALN